MREIAVLTVAVPLNQRWDEREVQRCHHHNKQDFGLQPRSLSSLRPEGRASSRPTRATPIDLAGIDVLQQLI